MEGRTVDFAPFYKIKSKRLHGGAALVIFYCVSSLTGTVFKCGTLLSVINSKIEFSYCFVSKDVYCVQDRVFY